MPPEHGSRRIASLDGLRAVSIALVLFTHAMGTRNFPLGAHALDAFGDIGYLGVRIFFVISGFLITTLLLKEHSKTGTVSLRAFYERRAFRIFPAAYAFVALVWLADVVSALPLRGGDVAHALTYTMNYHYTRSWDVGHLWSLSVEEQFYFLWPALVLLVGPRRIGHVAVAMIALAPVMRVLAWFLLPFRDDVIMEAYPCVMDAIAAGSLLAIAGRRLDTLDWYQRFLRSPLFLIVPLIVLVAQADHYSVAREYTLDITVQNLAIALTVDRCVRVTRGATFAVLNARPLVWVGTLSYSLYLWQEPFLNPKTLRATSAWPLNLVLAVLFAIASYHLVEKPFFSLRDKLARRRAAGATVAPIPAP